MLFIVIERFRENDMVPIYQRLRDSGRSLPDGLEYVDSWIEPSFARCFQLMRCDDPRLFQEWVLQWRGFGVTFEIVPVVPSKETQAVVAARRRRRSSLQGDAGGRRSVSRPLGDAMLRSLVDRI